MKFLQRAAHWSLVAIHWLAIVLFLVMVLLVLAQVVSRKFFEPLVWSEELARYIFIWVAFLGWIIATERRSHIAVTQFSDRAQVFMQRALSWFADGATLLLMGWLFWYGLKLVDNNRDVETVTLFFNYAVVYAVLPVTALAVATLTLSRAKNRMSEQRALV